MAALTLPSGLAVLFDEQDEDIVRSHSWCLHTTQTRDRLIRYAIAWAKADGRTAYMHRLVMAAPSGMFVDHINGDGLDNRRANLRLCTNQQNNANSTWPVGVSGYRGVSKTRNKFRAHISLLNKWVYLGSSEMAEEAARLYDAAAKKHFGEFARLNFPEGA